MTSFFAFELVVALPNRPAVFVVGMPYLRSEKSAAVLADQLSTKAAFSAVSAAKRSSSCKFKLHILPFVRLDYCGMAAFNIILQKWLKDRRKQTLSDGEIQHIINVFNIFDLTQVYMAELDAILEEYGIV